MRGLARRLYFWVLVGIVTGCVLGIAAPATAVTLKPLSDGFINLVKMLIGPDRLPDGGPGVCRSRRHEEGRARRRQGARLL